MRPQVIMEKLKAKNDNLFQTQKIHIKNLRLNANLLELENSLKIYFTFFGTVIDVKVLRHRYLNSQQIYFRFRLVWGRRSPSGGAEPIASVPLGTSRLNRFQ